MKTNYKRMQLVFWIIAALGVTAGFVFIMTRKSAPEPGTHYIFDLDTGETWLNGEKISNPGVQLVPANQNEAD